MAKHHNYSEWYQTSFTVPATATETEIPHTLKNSVTFAYIWEQASRQLCQAWMTTDLFGL